MYTNCKAQQNNVRSITLMVNQQSIGPYCCPIRATSRNWVGFWWVFRRLGDRTRVCRHHWTGWFIRPHDSDDNHHPLLLHRKKEINSHSEPGSNIYVLWSAHNVIELLIYCCLCVKSSALCHFTCIWIELDAIKLRIGIKWTNFIVQTCELLLLKCCSFTFR